MRLSTKGKMATYRQIQDFVRQKYGFQPKTCWIADVKELAGLNPRKAPNRISDKRKNPCPKNRIAQIMEAFRYFGMI
jgi:hypothetical protein